MSVSLTKGSNVNLTKEAPGLTAVVVGLGWDARTTDGAAFDLDASAIRCGADGKSLTDKDYIFWGNLQSEDATVVHQGDNLTGEGDGDDEKINVDLAGQPAAVDKIVFAVGIYEATQRNQTFGMVKHAYIRVCDANAGTELTRFDLGEDYANETALVFGEMYRNGTDWKFRATGDGWSSGIAGLATDYGVHVG